MKVEKQGNELIIRLEPNIELEEWKEFRLGDVALIAFKLKRRSHQKPVEAKLSEEEKQVLKKLLRIRFEERTLEKAKEVLSKEELVVLKEMLKRKLVRMYRKYEVPVINIPDDIYPLLNQDGKDKEKAKEAVENADRANGKLKPAEALDHLLKHGYAVIENHKVAEELSRLIQEKKLTAKVKAVVGFDKKIYFCTLPFLQKMESVIKKALARQGQIDLSKLKDKRKYHAYKAALAILLEKGDIIEKERDVFCPV